MRSRGFLPLSQEPESCSLVHLKLLHVPGLGLGLDSTHNLPDLQGGIHGRCSMAAAPRHLALEEEGQALIKHRCAPLDDHVSHLLRLMLTLKAPEESGHLPKATQLEMARALAQSGAWTLLF